MTARGDRLPTRRRHLLGALALALLVALGTAARVHGALEDPHFDRASPASMLQADPALLYYLLERVVDNGGLPPADWRADPRIEHPRTFDVPASLTVGQEFVVAWARLALRPDEPLHVFCVRVMALVASLVLIGVYGLALELSGRVRIAVLAAALAAVSLASYRTMGFVLMREDVSLPLFALHAFLLARAARTHRPGDAVLAAATAVLALATWHAMQFVALAEVLVLLAVFLRTARNAVAGHRGLAALLVLALGAVLVPVLREKAFLLSPPLALLAAMHAASYVKRPRVALAIAAGGGAALVVTGSLLTAAVGARGAPHVVALLLAKVLHFAAAPADPGALSFAARLMWQGPFESLPFPALHAQLGVTLWLVIAAAAVATRDWWRRRGDARFVAATAFGVGTTLLALLVQRFVVLPAIVAPAVGAVVLGRWWSLARGPIDASGGDAVPRAGAEALLAARLRVALAAGVAVVALLLQAGLWVDGMRLHELTWYGTAAERAERAAMLDAVATLVPRGAAVAGDPINSAAVLAFTGRPIVLQPKWEAGDSLTRIERLLTVFTRGTPAALHRLLRQDYRCEWLLVDRAAMWDLARESCGFPRSQTVPPPGTPAAAFCSDDPYALVSVPGFQLVWRSPATRGGGGGLYRLYRLR